MSKNIWCKIKADIIMTIKDIVTTMNLMIKMNEKASDKIDYNNKDKDDKNRKNIPQNNPNNCNYGTIDLMRIIVMIIRMIQ